MALLARDRTRVVGLLADPPTKLREVLDVLSPERVAAEISARVLLIHGRNDRAIPYTEALRLAAARPARTRVVLVGVFDHVEDAGGRVGLTNVGDLLTLWGEVYRLLSE